MSKLRIVFGIAAAFTVIGVIRAVACTAVPEPEAYASARAVNGTGLGASAGGTPPPAAVILIGEFGQSVAVGDLGLDAGGIEAGSAFKAVQIYDPSGNYDAAGYDAGADANAYPGLSLVPAVCPLRANVFDPNNEGPPPLNMEGCNAGTPFAIAASDILTGTYRYTTYRFGIINWGYSGESITKLLPGQTSYSYGQWEQQEYLHNAALDAGGPVIYGASFYIHGEADCLSLYYESQMTGLATDIQASVTAAIPYQTQPAFFLMRQQNARCVSTINATSSDLSTQYQLLVNTAPGGSLPGGIQVLGLDQAEYDIADDNTLTHHTTHGYLELGDKTAEVYALDQVWWSAGHTGAFWQALMPLGVTTNYTAVYGSDSGPTDDWGFVGGPAPGSGFSRAGNVETITYHVPNPPMQFGTSTWEGAYEPHQSGSYATYWSGAHGFEAWLYGSHIGNPVQITSAVISGSNIVLTMASSYDTICYAMEPDPNGMGITGGAGPPTGRSGTLHDSDTFYSEHTGARLPNTAVAFCQSSL